MEWKAVIPIDGGLAHYTLKQEGPGLYHARLTYYSGAMGMKPPDELILVKSMWHWTGSTSQQKLLDELGRAIDTSSQWRDNMPAPGRPDPII